jgi:hypothetical protein
MKYRLKIHFVPCIVYCLIAFMIGVLLSNAVAAAPTMHNRWHEAAIIPLDYTAMAEFAGVTADPSEGGKEAMMAILGDCVGQGCLVAGLLSPLFYVFGALDNESPENVKAWLESVAVSLTGREATEELLLQIVDTLDSEGLTHQPAPMHQSNVSQDYSQYSEVGIRQVMEVAISGLGTLSARGSDPRMSLRLDAQATAVDTSSGAVLGSWRVVRSTKKMYRLEDWAEQEGLAQSKYKELMRKVASDLVFSAYLAPEQRVFPKTRRTRSYSYHSQRGLSVLRTATPELKWKLSGKLNDGQGITWDLAIWEGETPVYQTTDLTEEYLQLPFKLQACVVYRWGVRAKFSEGGYLRKTSWSGKTASTYYLLTGENGGLEEFILDDSRRPKCDALKARRR